jgi:hypothetical protein
LALGAGMKKLFGVIFAIVLVVMTLVLCSAAVLAGSAFEGNWSGQMTFSINSVLGGPPESGTTDTPIITVRADGTLYTPSGSPGGLGLNGKIEANGHFSGTYITEDGSNFPITGTFANGHATLTKQPPVPNGISGVNITFELYFLGKGSTNYNPGSGLSIVNRLLSWLGKNPAIPVIAVVALFAVMALTGAIRRGMTKGKAAGRQSSSTTIKNSATGKASRVILQCGPTYSSTEPSNPNTPPKIIGPEDASGGTPTSGTGAYTLPVNQGGLNVQAEVTNLGIGNIWSNGIVEQPDGNYIPDVRANWVTDFRFQTYEDHFFIFFTNPPPPGAYLTWKITR